MKGLQTATVLILTVTSYTQHSTVLVLLTVTSYTCRPTTPFYEDLMIVRLISVCSTGGGPVCHDVDSRFPAAIKDRTRISRLQKVADTRLHTFHTLAMFCYKFKVTLLLKLMCIITQNNVTVWEY